MERDINSKEADANQHYIPVTNVNYRHMSTCNIGRIKSTILPQRKWTLTNEVNKNDQTLRLFTIDPHGHTTITQHLRLKSISIVTLYLKCTSTARTTASMKSGPTYGTTGIPQANGSSGHDQHIPMPSHRIRQLW